MGDRHDLDNYALVENIGDAEFLRAYENCNSGQVVNLPGIDVFPELARVDVPSHLARSWVVTLPQVSPQPSQGVQVDANNWAPEVIDRAFAIVEWAGGRQGGRAMALVDLNVGQTFSIYASMVRVRAGISGFATAAAPTAGSAVGAFIVPGRTDTHAQRTITYDATINNLGGTDEAAVPPFARRCWFSLRSVDYNAYRLEGLGFTAAGATLWTAQLGHLGGTTGAFPLGPLHIPLGTNFIRIVNSSGTNLTQFRIIYELAL